MQQNKKLTLIEDIEELENNKVEPIVSLGDDLSNSTLINQMIKSEWDAIDLYNSMLASFTDRNNEEIVDVIKDIISEEYIHVGQLEKLLQNINSMANHIDTGRNEENSDSSEVEIF